MKNKLFGILWVLNIFWFSVANSQEGPKFYLLGVPSFDHMKKSESYEGKIKKLIKNISPKSKKDIQVIVPASIVSKEISPKIGQKLWLFVNSKFYGVAEPTTFFASYVSDDPEDGGPNYGMWYQIDVRNIFPAFRNFRQDHSTICVSVPPDTQPQLEPRENEIGKVPLKGINEILNKILETNSGVKNYCGQDGDLSSNFSINTSLSFQKENVDFMDLKWATKDHFCSLTVIRTGKKIKILPNRYLDQSFQVLGTNYVSFVLPDAGSEEIEIWRVDKENVAKVFISGFRTD